MPEQRKVNARQGRSTLVRYREGESAESRHARRLRTNRKDRHKVVQSCAAAGIKLRVTDGGKQWAFYVDDRRFAVWHPWSATFVYLADKGAQESEAVHIHDWRQVLKELTWRLMQEKDIQCRHMKFSLRESAQGKGQSGKENENVC